MQSQNSIIRVIADIPGFWKRQHRDWRTTVVRTSLDRMAYYVIYPYLTLYLVSLGANKGQVGTITSVSLLLAGLISPYIGRIMDRNGSKRIYMLGIAMLALAYAIYTAAPVWTVAAAALIIYNIGHGLTDHSCGTICGNCLENCDRARGMLICETFGSGLLQMLGPIIGAWLLRRAVADPQAAAAGDYRPLFAFSCFITLFSFFFTWKRLSNRRILQKNPVGGSVLKEGLEIFRSNISARKWILIGSVKELTPAMILPYFSIYAAEAKGASVGLLAAIASASALTSMLLGYPVGVLADRFGRKKVLYFVIPLYWMSNILIVVSGSPVFLFLAGLLQGFYWISAPIGAAIQREIVEQEIMGTWIGIMRFITAIVSALGALAAGWIYEKLGGPWVFLSYVVLDALIRMPLLASLPETLHDRRTVKAEE